MGEESNSDMRSTLTILSIFAALTAAQLSPHPPAPQGQAPAKEYCWHSEDPTAHKCYDGCASRDFKDKGLIQPGVCNPHVFNKVTSNELIKQCSDGTTNLKYCDAPLYPVAIRKKTKGEAADALMMVSPSSPTQHCETMAASALGLSISNPTTSTIRVRTCNKYNPVSGAPCVGNPLKPNHYLDCPTAVQPGGSTVIRFNADTQYIAFTSEKSEIAELWPGKNGAWPATYTVQPASFEELLVRDDTLLKHYVQPSTSHCEDLVADSSTDWWKANSWKYARWAAGKCPTKFNYVNEVDHPAGRITHRTLGIAPLPEQSVAMDICDPTGYVHTVGTEGDDKNKCLEIGFGGGKLGSKFWFANGWKYSPPIGKQWSEGRCDRSAFPSVASTTPDYAGWTDAKNSGSGCGGVTLVKYDPKPEIAALFAMMAVSGPSYVHQIVTSPGDHCLEVTIPGGDASPFWLAEGWKYSAPVRSEWKPGQCDYTKWNEVDSTTNDYDGYTATKNSPYAAVTLRKYGIKSELEPL